MIKQIRVVDSQVRIVSYGRWMVKVVIEYDNDLMYLKHCTNSSTLVDKYSDAELPVDADKYIFYSFISRFEDELSGWIGSSLPVKIWEIQYIIDTHYHVQDRIEQLESSGYKIDHKFMLSGGVGQLKKVGKEYRMQIGYGKGRYNLAPAVILKNDS